MSNTRMDGSFASLLKPRKVKDLDRAWAAVAALTKPELRGTCSPHYGDGYDTAIRSALRAIEQLGGRDTTGGGA